MERGLFVGRRGGGGGGLEAGAGTVSLPERFKVVALMAVAMCLCNADRVVMSVAVVPLAAKNGWSSSFLGIVQVIKLLHSFPSVDTLDGGKKMQSLLTYQTRILHVEYESPNTVITIILIFSVEKTTFLLLKCACYFDNCTSNNNHVIMRSNVLFGTYV